MKPWFLIKSGYYIVPSPSTALPRSWVNWKTKFGFLAVIRRESFHKQTCKSRSSTPTKWVKYQKSLQYSNIGCGVFSSGIQNYLLAQSCQNLNFKVYPSESLWFFFKFEVKYQFRSTFLKKLYLLVTSIFQALNFL